MTTEQIKEKLKSDEYEFLREDKNLGNNIIILTLGGSHAYGTNNENSDLDIRGCALNAKVTKLKLSKLCWAFSGVIWAILLANDIFKFM